MTRSGQFVAECARVERCLYVNLLRRFRRVPDGEMGDEVKGCEEDIVLGQGGYLGILQSIYLELDKVWPEILQRDVK